MFISANKDILTQHEVPEMLFEKIAADSMTYNLCSYLVISDNWFKFKKKADSTRSYWIKIGSGYNKKKYLAFKTIRKMRWT